MKNSLKVLKTSFKITEFTLLFIALLMLGGFISFFSADIPINGIEITSLTTIHEVPRGLPFAFHAELATDPFIPGIDCLRISCLLVRLVPFLLNVVFWTSLLYYLRYLLKKYINKLRIRKDI